MQSPDTTNKIIGVSAATWAADGNQRCLTCNAQTTCTGLNIGATLTWGGFARASGDVNIRGLLEGPAQTAGKPNFGIYRDAVNDRLVCTVTNVSDTEVAANGATSGWANDNAFHQVLCEFNDSTDLLQPYINTATSGSAASVTSMRTVSGSPGRPDFYIGYESGVGPFAWQGQFDEAFIYSGILSATSKCRICSCGVDGTLCSCSGASFVSTGRNSSCGSCSLPANCSASTP